MEDDGAYVDQGVSTSIGSTTIGSKVIGGGGEVTANPFDVTFPVHTDKYQSIAARFEALAIGHAAINSYEYKDNRDKGRRSLGSLSELVSGAVNNKDSLTMQMPAGVNNKLMKEIGFGFTDVHLRFQVADFANILETVRTKVLEWSLQLEEAGVLGEGMTFSPEEQSAAKTAALEPTYYATNMTVVHSMSQSQIQQASPGATQALTVKTVDVKALIEFVKEVRAIEDQLPEEDRKQARADLATLEAQADAPTPSTGIVMEAAASLRKILESAAGSLTAANLPGLLQRAVALLS